MKNNFVKILISTFCIIIHFQAVAQQQKVIAKDITVKEFNRMITAQPGTILDVRTNGEVAKGAINKSAHIDLFDDNFETKIEQLDKSKPVYIYCASGGRSSEAMDIMKKKGFTELYNLTGGYSAWKRESKN